MKVDCPTCSKPVDWNKKSEFRPFCSKRCQLIDLGEWAEEQHNISTPLTATNAMEAGLMDPEQLEIDPEDIEEMLIKQGRHH